MGAAEGGTAPLVPPELLRRLERLAMLASRSAASPFKGEHASRRLGRSVEFSDYRNYVAGDDFRHLDWNAFGRLEKLFLKLFREESELSVHLLVDASASMGVPPAKSLQARRIAAALAWISLCSFDRLVVAGFTHEVGAVLGPVRGRGRMADCLRFLEQMEPKGRSCLREAARDFSRRRARPGLVVVVSDFLEDEDCFEGLKMIRHQRHDVFAVQVLHGQEVEPELGGDLRLVDAESGEVREVTVTEALVAAYRETVAAYLARMKERCAAYGLGYALAMAEAPLEDVVMRLLRHERLVGLMHLFQPAALAWLLLVPVVVLLYFMKLRRREHVVSAGFLWQRAARQARVDSFFQRLRINVLLILQVLAIVLLALASARPWVASQESLPAVIVFVLDASASMQATEAGRPRFDLARERALSFCREAPPGTRFMLIRSTTRARVDTPLTADREEVRRALERATTADAATDLKPAMLVALAVCREYPDARVFLLTDREPGDAGLGQDVMVKERVHYLPVGARARNVAITAFDARPAPRGGGFEVFARVDNLSEEPVSAFLELHRGGALVDARELHLAARRGERGCLSAGRWRGRAGRGAAGGAG